MNTKAILLFAVVCTGSVLGSYYHGPTAIPHVLQSGYLADTHEVAAAKGAHLTALSQQSHHGYGDEYSGSYGYGGSYGSSYGHGNDLRYHGPTAIPHVLSNGHIADTHEVAVAKGQHYAAVAAARTHGGHGYAGDYGYSGSDEYNQGGHRGSYGSVYDQSYTHGHDIRYHGPIAIPHVLGNGHIADTHEVAAAKADHYNAVAEARAHSGCGYGYGHGYSHGNSGHY